MPLVPVGGDRLRDGQRIAVRVEVALVGVNVLISLIDCQVCVFDASILLLSDWKGMLFVFVFSYVHSNCNACFISSTELGDTAKRRFQDFAASWNDPNRQSHNQRPLFGGGGGGSQSNVNRGNERRGLLSNDLNMEEEEEELDFVGGGHGGGSGRDFEMNDVAGRGDKKKD